MTEAEREFIKWLVADYTRVLEEIRTATGVIIGSLTRDQERITRVAHLCVNSTQIMQDKLAKLPESDRAKW